MMSENIKVLPMATSAGISLNLLDDTGVSNNDLISALGTIDVKGLTPGALNTWQYSIDTGKTWSSAIPIGLTNRFDVPAGIYNGGQVRVKQQIIDLPSNTNLLQNSSFEQGWVGTGWTGISDLPGWKTADKFEIWGKSMSSASEGSYLLEIDYDRKLDSITQAVTTIKDANYTLKFDMKSRGGGNESLNIFWRGEKLSTAVTSQSNGWKTFSFNILGSGAQDELKFEELQSENNGSGSLIDNISINIASSPQSQSPVNTNSLPNSGIQVVSAVKKWWGMYEIINFNSRLDNHNGIISAIIQEETSPGTWTTKHKLSKDQISIGEVNLQKDSIDWQKSVRIISNYVDKAGANHTSMQSWVPGTVITNGNSLVSPSTTYSNQEDYLFSLPFTIDKSSPVVNLSTPGGKDGTISSQTNDRSLNGTASPGGIVTIKAKTSKFEDFETSVMPKWINIDTPNINVANIKLDTVNRELDFSASGGKTNLWTSRDNAPMAWVSRPNVSNGETWFIETKVRVDKRAQAETISGITFYNNKDGDFQYGAPSFYLDSWHHSGTNVSLQGLGNNSPFVSAANATNISGDQASTFLRTEITEKGTNDDYKFFYKKNEGDSWIQLGSVYSYSIDNSRAALFLKTGSAKQGGAAFDSVKVGKVDDFTLVSNISVNQDGTFSHLLSDIELKLLGEGANKSIVAVQTNRAGNSAKSNYVDASVDTEVSPITITSIGGGDGKVSDQKVEVGKGSLQLTLDQYTGYWSSNLRELQNYVKNHNPATTKNKYSILTDAIDYTDDAGGFAGELSFDRRWPAAEAINYWGTGGINNQFFVKISGEFFTEKAGNYRFRTFNDDGVFLIINGTTVINDPTLHPERVFTGDIQLAKGNNQLELYFFENGGEASLEFSVSQYDEITKKWGGYQLMGKDPSIKSKSIEQLDNIVTGKGEPNATIHLKLGEQDLGTTTANTDGSFEYKLNQTNLALLANSSINSSVIAYQYDQSGNISTSQPSKIELTEKPPVVEVIAIGNEDKIVSSTIDDNKINGTGNPGILTTIMLGTEEIGNILTDSAGKFNYVFSQDNLNKIGQGTNKALRAIQKTIGGITGESKSFSFNVDTIAPNIKIKNIGREGKLSTKNNSISGEADPLATVIINKGGKELARSTTNDKGQFLINLSQQSLQEFSLSAAPIYLTQTDSAGNIGSLISTPVSAKVSIPVITPSGIGGVDSTISTQNSDLLISGKAEPGLPVSLWYNQIYLGSTNPSNTEGNFTYTLSASDLQILGQGSDKLITFKQTDEYENEGLFTSSSFLVDTIAPIIETSPKGSATALGGADAVISTKPGDNLLKWYGETNQISILNINNQQKTVTGLNGEFKYTFSNDDINNIGQGLNKFVLISQADIAGNRTTANISFDVDTIAPSKPQLTNAGIKGVLSSLTGSNLLAGIAEPYSDVSIFVDDVFFKMLKADKKGAFMYELTSNDISKLGQGEFKINAIISDLAGNMALSDNQKLIIDTIAPFKPIIDTVGGLDNIVSTKGSGLVTESIDNKVSGSAEKNSKVEIYGAGVLLGETKATNDGIYTYGFTAPNLAFLQQGKNKSIEVLSIDLAGNISTASDKFQFSIDTLPPSTPKIQSIGGSDGILSTQPNDNILSGLADLDTSLILIAKNSLSSLSSINLLYITGITTDPKGKWSYALSPEQLKILNDSQNSNLNPQIQIISIDQAGNEAKSVATQPKLDLVAPSISFQSIGGTDNVITLATGDSTILGKTDPKVAVLITIDGKTLATVQSGLQGNFSYTLNSSDLKTIGEGSNKLAVATQTDKAGNQSSISKQFNVDTIAPESASIKSIGGMDKIVTSIESDRVVIGKAEAGSTIDLYAISGANKIILGSMQVDQTGEFNYTLTPNNLSLIGRGVGKSIVISSRDSVGNTSISKPFSFEVQAQWKTGSAMIDTLSFASGVDSLTGLDASDLFVVSNLSAALIGGTQTPIFDRIIDFQIGFDKIDAPSSISPGSVSDHGNIQTLSTLHISKLLDQRKFTSNSAALFHYQDAANAKRTFLALNDNVPGFDFRRDSVIEISGYAGNLSALGIV